MKPVYLIIDMINDLVHEDGAFGKSPVYTQVQARDVVRRTALSIARARAANVPIGFIRTGFSDDYKEAPPVSPIFSPAREKGFFRAASWGGQFHDLLKPLAGDLQIVKHRVSPFFATPLDLVLRQLGATHVYLSGVSTNGVIVSAVKDAHDLDYRPCVFEDTCAAANAENHRAAMLISERYADVLDSSSFDFCMTP